VLTHTKIFREGRRSKNSVASNRGVKLGSSDGQKREPSEMKGRTRKDVVRLRQMRDVRGDRHKRFPGGGRPGEKNQFRQGEVRGEKYRMRILRKNSSRGKPESTEAIRAKV